MGTCIGSPGAPSEGPPRGRCELPVRIPGRPGLKRPHPHRHRIRPRPVRLLPGADLGPGLPFPHETGTTMGIHSTPAAALAAAFLSACTVTSVGAENGPPRVESDGLLEGHAAFGWRAEDRFLRLHALEGDSDGAVAELVLWKLFRLEVGALGLGIGVGPFDLALGTLFYEPDVPEMHGVKQAAEASSKGSIEDCEICRGAQEAGAQVP